MDTDLRKELKAFEADHVWVEQNRERLLAEYAEQWIAVRDGQVIASDPDFSGLLAKIPDPAHTCVEYMATEPVEMILLID